MASIDFSPVGVIFRKPFSDFPALRVVVEKAPKLRATVQQSDMENLQAFGQVSIVQGQSYGFLFRSPDFKSGWSFAVSLHKEVAGSESIYEWEGVGDAIRPNIASEDSALLESGDYILIAKITKDKTTEVDVIRLHVGVSG